MKGICALYLNKRKGIAFVCRHILVWGNVNEVFVSLQLAN